jgi:hypothetical protein
MISQDDLTVTLPESEIAIQELKKYLELNMGNAVDKYYGEWPDSHLGEYENTLSIHTVNAAHTHVMPSKESETDIIEDASKVAALYRTGKFDLTLQVDIWSPYKVKRNELFKLFHDTLNKEFAEGDSRPTGLSLQLAGYYNVIARYDITGYNFPDSERGSQEDDWRAVIDLQVHFDTKRYKLLTKIQETIIVDKDEVTEEEWISETVIIDEQ